MTRRKLGKVLSTLGVTTLVSAATLVPSQAQACGGFFCSLAQPVNQAAERIVFAQNDDGTVTAVIQIMYEGPSENFSWLLPISTVLAEGDLAVSSDIAFQRLQSFTNPTYSLNVSVEGTCKLDDRSFDGGFLGATGGSGSTGGVAAPGEGVEVEASGVVGKFEWTIISFDPALDDPAAAAVVWLEANGYDVTEQGAELIGPYLNDGMYLLALKLVKGATTGSIRPIALTYAAEEPLIPIKLTAVAANDDMGVMTWVLGEERAVPSNYLSLELNEAQINWFNPAPTYNDVVIQAAQEAGGQGFVTEFAGAASQLSQAIWSTNDEATWNALEAGGFVSLDAIFNYATNVYSGWDGYWDAVRDSVTLPEGITVEDLQLCFDCYSVEFIPTEFIASLETNVIEPVRMLQDLVDTKPYATRLYTTMSAVDMTLDPAFTFNADLPDLSNTHVADRIIECNPNIYESDAPWRIELPQGGVIRGTAADANGQAWPSAVTDQPFNFTIRQLSASGEGQVVRDNSETVNDMLAEYNASLNLPEVEDTKTAKGGGGCSVGYGPNPTWLGPSGLFGLALVAGGLAGRGFGRRARVAPKGR